MSILIGGGSGFVGSAFAAHLRRQGLKYKIISRMSRPDGITWSDVHKALPTDAAHVVNLAGATLSDFTKSWSRGYKQEVFDSRINTTRALAEAVDRSPQIKTFVHVSAVGFYPPSQTAVYDETSKGGDDTDVFTTLCREWEGAGQLKSSSARHVILRLGVVLGKQGGMVKSIYWPFFFGLGGPVGSGKQWFPWIHVDDLASLLTFTVTSQSQPTGIFNAVAPQAATSADFAREFSAAMHRPALFGTPEFAVKCLFDADRAKLVLTGQKVVPKRTLEAGFQFKYPDLKSACEALVKNGSA